MEARSANHNVNCRIGSLENFISMRFILATVNCRIGSLETIDEEEDTQEDS